MEKVEKKEEKKEKNDNGDAPANGTVSWRRELASWPFVLAALIMQVSLHPPPPPVQPLSAQSFVWVVKWHRC